eukprot:4945493-Karenia_brevis.AAC.1
MEWAKCHQSSFGKMRGLFKAFHGCTEVLQLMESGEQAQAQASLIQLVKGLLQVALDKGDWATAQLLLPWQDPTARAEWGGDEKELEEIYKYRRAIKELRAKVGH